MSSTPSRILLSCIRRLPSPLVTPAISSSSTTIRSISSHALFLPGHSPASFRLTPSMSHRKGKTARREQQQQQQWVQRLNPSSSSSTQSVADSLSTLNLSHSPTTAQPAPTSFSHSPLQFGGIPLDNYTVTNANTGRGGMWMPKSYATAGEPAPVQAPSQRSSAGTPTKENGNNKAAATNNVFQGNFGANFTVDNQAYCKSQIRATFYPKFENEKSDQEIRTRMIEMVSHGLATLEVSLKHSGSLFMYAGPEGGAYAKNSFGNVYTAVGVFVLGRMFHEAWGTEARKRQMDFNDFLEKNHVCISMELVTAVLGDHGQRPLQDYVVVTAVTELGNGKPKFYSTPDIIAFCRKWRLPTNHVWLFSTRKSVTSFFAAYDALCEEGTATPVCRALDEVADISIPGSKNHIKAQGEILEGLVARIVSPGSPKHMEEVLREFPPTLTDGVSEDLGPSLREICAANRSEEQQQIKALLQNAGPSICPDDADWFGDCKSGGKSKLPEVLSKFLQAQPTDFSTTKLQELIRLMRQRYFRTGFKCYPNFHKVDSLSNDNIHFRMVIHVFNDSVFRRYQQEMRRNRGLWPLYRGFFVDINLFKANKEKANELVKDSSSLLSNMNGGSTSSTLGTEELADEDANLMIKLKFLTYKLRTFLIRNGLPILFKEGPSAYRTYYLRQMKNFGTSAGKQRELSKMLDEWAVYIRRKCGNKQLPSSIYLSEAEPFLEQYAKCSPENQALIGSAGDLVRSEDFLAIVGGGGDEEGDLIREGETSPSSPSKASLDTVQKDEGLIVFFPGMPGCAKSALCKELLSAPGGFGDKRPVHSLMGDLIKGRYWQKVAEERRRKPDSIILADKNAPNEEVWMQIENMCRSTRASAVPVVPDSEGTISNPFSLDALAVFIFRVLQRVNHPGNLDKASPNAGYVLLLFYHLYKGKNRREFENELSERFGGLIRMPLLKADRSPMPDAVKATLEEGIDLFKLHSDSHGRLDPSKGKYAKEWARWEKQIRGVMLENADCLNSIQVPFDFAVSQVLEQLKAVAKGEYQTLRTEKKTVGNIVFAAVTLPTQEISSILDKVGKKYPRATNFLASKGMENNQKAAHVTLAHKRSHGVAAVASFGIFLGQKVPVELIALLFSDKFAALEARLGTVEGEQINSMNQWPHVTIWTDPGCSAKEANALPQLVSDGKATRVDLDPPLSITGTLDFY